MPRYPSIDDNLFYDKITKVYSKYKIPSVRKSFDTICNPKEYKLQLPQQFVADFMSPYTPYNGILVYHRIGSGKTCTAIQVAEKWKGKKKIVVVLPASLKGNFRTELRSLCGGENYLLSSERKQLASLNPSDASYKKIIENSDKRIDKYYNIYSYNKFITSLRSGTVNLKNTLLIIDEIQNMVSEDGSFYATLHKYIEQSPDGIKIVLLSATPMFDRPNELALTMNLFKLKEPMPTNREFDKLFINKTKSKDEITYTIQNTNIFKDYLKGYISYFKGAPSFTFPDLTLKYVNCVMSDFQYKAYVKSIDEHIDVEDHEDNDGYTISNLPMNFHIGTRIVSNIVFPNMKYDKKSINTFTNEKILKDLSRYSSKFFEIMKRVNKSTGKVFFYSSFKNLGGIKSFIHILEANGYSDYLTNGTGDKRFAVWSGDVPMNKREEIKTVFNKINNINGSKIKIILASLAAREGISFTGIRQVHLLEPYWNKNRLEQIIGRASRYCSHKDLPQEKRNVKVYIYMSVHPKIIKSVDQFMKELIIKKDKLIAQFEKALKETAVDCELNKNANNEGMDKEHTIKCSH